MTVKRKLAAVEYPNIDINVKDEKQFRQLIIWLEQNRIKQCSNDEKRALTNANANDWNANFMKFATKLGCPIAVEKREACADWFLGYALQAEYTKNEVKYNKFAVDNLKSENVPNVVADNPLDHLNFTSKEFEEGINKLADILKICRHPNPLVTFEACSKLIQRRLHSKALENPKEYIIEGTPFPYKDADLGFELNDKVLNEAAKVMRLLYIHDLRTLQTKANECIVSVQSVTADPKTDTKLGKVGMK